MDIHWSRNAVSRLHPLNGRTQGRHDRSGDRATGGPLAFPRSVLLPATVKNSPLGYRPVQRSVFRSRKWIVAGKRLSRAAATGRHRRLWESAHHRATRVVANWKGRSDAMFVTRIFTTFFGPPSTIRLGLEGEGHHLSAISCLVTATSLHLIWASAGLRDRSGLRILAFEDLARRFSLLLMRNDSGRGGYEARRTSSPRNGETGSPECPVNGRQRQSLWSWCRFTSPDTERHQTSDEPYRRKGGYIHLH
jgi:hypothetical protein